MTLKSNELLLKLLNSVEKIGREFEGSDAELRETSRWPAVGEARQRERKEQRIKRVDKINLDSAKKENFNLGIGCCVRVKTWERKGFRIFWLKKKKRKKLSFTGFRFNQWNWPVLTEFDWLSIKPIFKMNQPNKWTILSLTLWIVWSNSIFLRILNYSLST